jgi:hypothetical protein
MAFRYGSERANSPASPLWVAAKEYIEMVDKIPIPYSLRSEELNDARRALSEQMTKAISVEGNVP